MHYDISMPVDEVFHNIEDLSDLADYGKCPLPFQKMIDIAYVLFSKQTILTPDIRSLA